MTVLKPELAPPRLTPPGLKRELLAAAGVDYLVVLPPVPEVLDLSAEDFWAILRNDVRPAALVEGKSFTFGKGRGGTIDRLREWARTAGVALHVVAPVSAPLLDLSVVPVSSSLIRWLLLNGRARDAAVSLGRGYVLEGEVVKGFQRGRTIGVPTANLRCGDQLLPGPGVYAARCDLDGTIYPAALSVGTMPTFGADQPQQVEAHLIGFSGDLYGRVLRVEIVDWLRDQIKYDGIDALKAQMARDLAATIERVRWDPARTIASAG
jgi:riboflavin kinase/FMN adenylyltransferase